MSMQARRQGAKQSTISTSGTSSKENREEVVPRNNGWECPWHPLQYLVWFFILFCALNHYGFLGHYVPGLWRIPIFLIPGLLGIVFLVSIFVATFIDPAEPSFKRRMAAKSYGGIISRPRFNRKKHKHVIEDNYCNLCQVNV